MASGPAPTRIGGPGRPVARLIGVTVSEPLSVTSAVLPSGVMAMACGSAPTRIAGPARLVAVLIGVTVPDPLFTT
jgi:hypothetical protein